MGSIPVRVTKKKASSCLGREVFSCIHAGNRKTALALPLGELSPQVTERVLQSILDGKVDLFAHTMKISVDIPVRESQNLQTKSRQELRTLSIISQTLGFIMLGSVQFNDQSGRSAVKVHDESTDDSLFINLHRIFTEKKIPELAFMGRHFPAKPSGIFQLAVIFWYGHIFPLRPRLARPPLPKGEASSFRWTFMLFLARRLQQETCGDGGADDAGNVGTL